MRGACGGLRRLIEARDKPPYVDCHRQHDLLQMRLAQPPIVTALLAPDPLGFTPHPNRRVKSTDDCRIAYKPPRTART